MPRLEHHPFASEYPLADANTLAIIVADMRSRGYDERFPITLYGGKILDGRNRDEGAEQAGVFPTFTTFEGSEEDARAFVARANENRRHLTDDWLEKRRKERRERVAAARTEGQSLRTIAENEGVSPTTVKNDLETAGVKGVNTCPENGKITGADGREYSATVDSPAKPDPILCDRCKRDKRVGNSLPKSCKDCKKLREDAKPKKETPDVVKEPERTDKAGVPIHERTAQAFALADSIGEMCRRLDAIAREVEEAAKSPGGRLIHASVAQSIRSARKTLWASRATHVCPYCEGEGECEACKDEGWLSATYYEQAPPEKKGGRRATA